MPEVPFMKHQTVFAPAVLALFGACEFPRPADVGDDTLDAGELGVTIHVSSNGDDANDGRVMPVRTLKRAIVLAGTNVDIREIRIEAGRYTLGTGEVFPYVVPPNVTIAGPLTGGAVLVGSKAEDALSVGQGKLQDLELENFDTAITSTGAANLTNIRVRASKLAIRGMGPATLAIDNLDVEGAVDACGSGIELQGTASLSSNGLIARNLTTTLRAREHSTVMVAKLNATADARCPGPQINVSTTEPFLMSDSLVFGGMTALSAGNGAQVTVVDTAFQNTTYIALTGGAATFKMSGGAISNNLRVAVELYGGSWSFTGVKIQRNSVSAMYIQGVDGLPDARLVMRDCSVVENGGGIALFDRSAGDLGTDASPGGNVIQGNGGVGISVAGAVGPKQVDAVGNTWNPNVQGADANGRYATTATVVGPVDLAAGANYQVDAGLSIRR